MQAYLHRALGALDHFDVAADTLAHVTGRAPLADRARATATELVAVTTALRTTLDLPTKTAIDISDLQVRLEDESRRLARCLRSLGEATENAKGGDRPVADELLPTLRAIEEHAQRVAAAIFPSAIEGIRDINKALWDIRGIWRDYGEVLDRGLRGKLSGMSISQLDAVDAAARDVLGRFEAVNDVLNELLMTPLVGEADAAASLVDSARSELKAAVKRARLKAASHKPFHEVLGRAERVASRVSELFDQVRIPVFPPAERLDAFSHSIEHDAYMALAGVERFALMNIGSRLHSIELADGSPDTLAAARFDIRVFDVFPDRIYFSARRTFIEAVEELARAGVFASAPAGLHRFRDGSFKQTERRKGNLQVSYAAGSDTDPGDTSRVCVDADIDLYRGTVAHLFGEVLVNHLTGSKTDQFKVWDTLVKNEVEALGGFDVVRV